MTVALTRSGSGSGTDPIPWVSDFRAQTGTMPVGARPELDGTLRNVSRLRIDARQTCLKGSALAYRLTTDGRLTVLVSGGRRLARPAGTHTGTIAR